MDMMASSPLSGPFVLAMGSAATAQIIKFVWTVVGESRVNFKRLVELGGKPSAHSASVAALSTGVGIQEGLRSPVFGMALFFSLLTMYDAAGIRRSAGRQAEVLNKIVDDLQMSGKVREERLLELLGHTPFEVLAGAALGVAFAVLFGGVGSWHG
ncbi:MAG: divergent PAP2 family protein [Gemmatimonadota bacterium]|nr:divergent PAP2 family protein [Gemmatimonadota bacterium]